ncbi:MAG: protein kinase, partial [Acidobacteria bacterium]|nr:protein kinase [Acidobacteriota bacterium]
MPLERLKSRYEIKAQLGAGGMGVVYRAWDLQAQREVAIKTIRDTHSQSALDLFRKELHFQKTLNHPNIVDIFDIGEFEMEGRRIPYFVMPLLPGQTLDRVIRNERISMSRCLEIVNQVARGLQALHDKALVHRDLKPSNIFILPGDSVKIIDFGLAHLIDRHSSVEVRGTLLYMSPEQIQMKPATYASDIFALGVICYEMLSGKHPFEAGNREEIIARILGGHPPALSQLNPSVSTAVSQAVHAAMAKRPSHRYTSVAEYAEILRKAAYNEPIERFNPARLEQRVERVRKALDEGDFSSAADVLNAIEAEGCLRQDIPALRRQVDHALRQQNMRQLLESARKRFLEHEHQLALGNLQELLNLDPIHAEALTLKATIEQDWRNSRIDTWFRVAREHASNREYALAREALHNVLQLSANDAEARRLLAEIDQDEAEYARMGEEKERLARAAAADRDRGDFDSAMAQLERLLRIEESHPAKGVEAGRSPYQKAYEETRAEAEALRNAYAEARQHLDQRRFAEARRTCEQYLSRYPDHVLFHTLKVDAEHAESRDLLNYIAQIDRDLEAERDLERKIRILQDAIARTPVEHFQRSLESLQSRRDLVQKIVARARNLEDRAQYTEAISQWETLRTVYGDYPGLDAEIQRLQQLRQRESRQAAKSVATSQISRKLEAADFAAAAMLTDSALRDFPDDPELLALQRVASEGKERSVNAGRLFDESQRLFTEQRTQESLSLLRKAQAMDPQNTRIRTRLVELLVAQAQARLDSDPQSAEAYLQEALELDAQNPFAISCRRVLDERKSTAMVEQSLAQARALKAAGDFEGALAAIGRAIESNPQEPRLVELQATIYESMRTRQNQTRQRNLEEARDLQRQAANLMESDALQAVFARTQAFAAQHPGDPDFQNIAAEVQQRTMLFPAQERAAAPAPPPPVPAEPKKKPAVAAPGMLARAWAAWHRMVPRR